MLDVLDASFGAQFTHLGARWAHLPALLRGRISTRRLTDPEVDHDLLDLSPDLAVVAGLDDASMLQLANGAGVTVAYGLAPEDVLERGARGEAIASLGSIVLPPGRLADLQVSPGDLVSITVVDGAIEFSRVYEVQAHSDATRSHLIEIASTGMPLELETAVLMLCADLDDAFRSPHPPFGELLEDTGLARNGDRIASAGFDFVAYRADVRARSLAARHGLTHDQAMTVAAAVTLHRSILDLLADPHRAQTPDGRLDREQLVSALSGVDTGTGVDVSTTPGSGHSLESRINHDIAAPEVAEAILPRDRGLGRPARTPGLVMLTELLEDTAGHSARPALRWLRAMAYERLGQISEAENTPLTAERLDPSWPLILLDLARNASDRGDSSRGLALLARADPYEDPDLTELLQAFRPVPGPTVGRNQPYWCGSGAQVQAVSPASSHGPPLAERAAWLYQKAGRFLTSGAWDPVLDHVADQRAAYEEGDTAIESALEDPAVGDVMLFEGGVFAKFVRQRGFLLPDDEAQLAEQWLQVKSSVSTSWRSVGALM